MDYQPRGAQLENTCESLTTYVNPLRYDTMFIHESTSWGADQPGWSGQFGAVYGIATDVAEMCIWRIQRITGFGREAVLAQETTR